MTASQPTSTDEIGLLFSALYWVPTKARSDVADEWRGCMKLDLINLSDYESVREWSVTIYNHLASQNMPLTTDTSQYWPAEVLETFRLWVNAGWPETADSPTDWADRIPAPETPENTLRIRKDISTLSDAELNEFRARLDDRLRVSDASHDSPWQMWAYIHTNWCLHYQEAFFFWHRAYLMYLEKLIGMAIPYWDWMAADASDPRSPLSGFPQAFMDETYVHPGTGQTRPNPLRFAAAKDGRSKMCVSEPDHCHGDMCWHVNRLPVFDLKKNPHFRDRDRHFRMPGLFQQQVVDALKFETLSTPQGDGMPWANIPAFDPPQKDSLYPHRDVNFDGLYEQPHDNYHGWIGYDMADNSYTAFDPIFLSYHANIDRMLETWVRAHPGTQYTTQTQLQPFVGPLATAVNQSRI